MPVLYSGPYSYDAAPVEKLFSIIKHCDLNPLSKSFNSRQSCDTYINWLAESINTVKFGNIAGLFRRSLRVNERYIQFQDI